MQLRSKSFAAAAAVALVLGWTGSSLAAYPTNICVSGKQKAASKFCGTVGKAWAKYHSNPTADPGGANRDATIAAAATKMSGAWTKAEDKSTKKGVDCSVTTVDAATASTDLTTAMDSIQGIVTATLDTTASANDAKCASLLMKSVGKMCAGILKAQAKHVKKPGSDPNRAKLQFGMDKAQFKFQSGYDKAAPRCDGTAPVAEAVSSSVFSSADALVLDTVTSPGAPEIFTEVPFDAGDEVTYEGETLRPICSRGTPYSFWYKRGTTNKLLMYYQGGGACWSQATCWIANTFKDKARDAECVGGPSDGDSCALGGDSDCDFCTGGANDGLACSGPVDCPDGTCGGGVCGPWFSNDNPDLVGTGFADPNDSRNIFKDWHVVFVSYCTGDVHWGNNSQFYAPGQTINHRGRINARVAEKWAREHFPLPEQVFVTGSSAGAYGAIFNSAFLMHDVYPSSPFDVLGDAGAGVITKGWLEDSFPVWAVQDELPVFIPDLQVPAVELSMVEMWEHIARFFPNNDFAMYQSAYDGSGGGQAAFYNVMANPGNILEWPKWWQRTCEWNACMRQFVEDIAGRVPNFNYYTGAGSRHTVYGSDKLYEDTTGGMPVLLDWLQAMIDDDDPNWASQHCGGTGVGAGCDLVDTCQGGANKGLPCTSDLDCPGGACEEDPEPSPLQPPYEPANVVNCAPTVCPCGDGPNDVVCGLP